MSRPPEQLSRITNGSALLPGVDGRGRWARRFKDLVELHTDDLGGDGELSEMGRQLIKRAAALGVECERIEAAFAHAGAAETELLDTYLRMVGVLKRLSEAVGTQRRARQVPTLHETIEAAQVRS